MTSAGKDLLLWRLERERHMASWSSGVGAKLAGGRWNTKGRAAVYGACDPSTAILEVAVHKGFKALDTIPHMLLCVRITDPDSVFEVVPQDLPNPNWLVPGSPSLGQQCYGDELLSRYPFITVPSTVSRHSRNIVMNPLTGQEGVEIVVIEPFALDPRLHPPAE